MKANRRRAGVLLHPTSLPGEGLHGVMGKDAYRFIDFMKLSGIGVWQLLPLGPTHENNSPYQSLSAHAGNPDLICWSSVNDYEWCTSSVANCTEAYAQFSANANEHAKNSFAQFQQDQAFWLNDYAVFMVAKSQQQGKSWVEWPTPLRNREKKALEEFEQVSSVNIAEITFEQYLFFEQWLAIKNYANQNDIALFGDLPLFLAHDSADVWAKREYFKLDGEGHSLFVAGVPPDYFSETGQLWGNPVYDWQSIASDGYSFWTERLQTQLILFDTVRIDHFRGLEAYWEIPANHETALNGYWVKGPGDGFFEQLTNVFGADLPLVAEDLGFITPEVDALREKFSLPGMKILQFAFDSDAANPYLPHHHEKLSVVYTGTHDNNTTCGWYDELSDAQKQRVKEYFGCPDDTMPWLLIRSAMMSVSNWAVVPMQDFLELDAAHRMNIPGTVDGNWSWRFTWEDADFNALALKIKDIACLYGRD